MSPASSAPPLDTERLTLRGHRREDYAESAWGLLDRHVFRGGKGLSVRVVLVVAVLAWAIIVGWIFVQDNDAGRLENAIGVTRFWYKARMAGLFMGAGSLFLVLVGWFPRVLSAISSGTSCILRAAHISTKP